MARSSPSLPPGFGPPRTAMNTSTPKPASVTRDRSDRRIARGPDLSSNFSTRIAHAKRLAASALNASNSFSSRIQPHHIQTVSDDLRLSNEIDRLFGDEESVPEKAISDSRNGTSTGLLNAAEAVRSDPLYPAGKDHGTAPTYPTTIGSEVDSNPQGQQTPSVKDGDMEGLLTATDSADADISFDDFARLVAAQSGRTKKNKEKEERIWIREKEAVVSETKTPNGSGGESTSIGGKRGQEKNSSKKPVQDDSVEALAKWFSSLAAAADAVESHNPVEKQTSEYSNINHVANNTEDNVDGSAKVVSVARRKVDLWMDAVHERALAAFNGLYSGENLESIEVSFEVDDIARTVPRASQPLSAPTAATAGSGLNQMMAHLTSSGTIVH